jgi:hypothetical protein
MAGQPPGGARRRGEAWAAAAAYTLLSVALTWPLAPGLGRDIPKDLADPLLNTWIVAWGAEHVVRFLSGDLSAFAGFWNANIFHPAPLTLTCSEHLFAQAVQAAPVYALTGNAILCYNLLFLSSFVLSGLALFLLVRDLTGDSVAAFAGGVFFAFAPFRFEHGAHLQLLSLQWLPLALLGLRRFVAGGRLVPLAWTTLALVAHNLSCGYYLLFFAPFVAAWALFEMVRSGQLASARRWLGLAASAAITLAASLPFLLPYREARQLEETRRSVLAVAQFSADLAGWLTATPDSRVWAPLLPGVDRPENHLFPGLLVMLLAAVPFGSAAVGWFLSAAPRSRRRAALVFLVSLLGGGVVAHRVPWPVPSLPAVAGPGFTLTPVGLMLFLAGALGTALVVSAGSRRQAARVTRSYAGFAAAAVVLGVWLSLGEADAGASRRACRSYSWLYERAGDRLRAPALRRGRRRLPPCWGLGVARLRGLALAAAVGRASAGVHSGWLVAAVAALEAVCLPLPLNRTWDTPGLHTPPPPGHGARPAVYAAARELPREAVLVELPIGEVLWETRAMYHSTSHWRRLVNGYSGHFPRSYIDARAALRDGLRDPDATWAALRQTGATHVIVHRWAWYRTAIGARLARGFEERGARRLGEWEDDVLLELPPL